VELPPPTNEFSSSEESASDYDLPCSLEELVLLNLNPHFLTQHELNDLIRDLGLTKCND
jgi:hypothetical protein